MQHLKRPNIAHNASGLNGKYSLKAFFLIETVTKKSVTYADLRNLMLNIGTIVLNAIYCTVDFFDKINLMGLFKIFILK